MNDRVPRPSAGMASTVAEVVQVAACQDEQMEFKPRYAIVTGSDSGIGRATAVALAEQGLDVGITWHSDSARGRRVRRGGARRTDDGRWWPNSTRPNCRDCGDVIDHLPTNSADSTSSSTTPAPAAARCFVDYTRTRTGGEVVAINLDGAFVCLQRAARRMIARWTRRSVDRGDERARTPAARRGWSRTTRPSTGWAG